MLDIYISYNYEIKCPINTLKNNWNFGINVPYHKVDISPSTCRPYYNINDNGQIKKWIDKAKEIYGNKLFSTNNFFGNYVSENKKYPTKNELLNYIFKYHSTRGKNTLPICIEQFVDEVFLEYKEIIDNIPPKEFAIRWGKSVYINIRRSME